VANAPNSAAGTIIGRGAGVKQIFVDTSDEEKELMRESGVEEPVPRQVINFLRLTFNLAESSMLRILL